MNNSGKMNLENAGALNLGGFEVVYFFSYPEQVIKFNGAADAA